MKKLVHVLALVLLTGCASHRATAPRVDTELARDSSLARAAFDNGAVAKAVDLYGQALKRATAMDDAAAISSAAYNLALCQVILGQLDQASATLADAESALRRSGENPADVWLLEATIAERRGQWEQALALTKQVLSASPEESHRFQAELLQGRVAFQQGDLAQAKAALAETSKHRIGNPTLLAAQDQLAGDIFLREGNPAAASRAFDRAASLFRQGTHYQDMATALYRAGQAYQQAGDTPRAEDRLMRAQRSLAAQEAKAGEAYVTGRP